MTDKAVCVSVKSKASAAAENMLCECVCNAAVLPDATKGFDVHCNMMTLTTTTATTTLAREPHLDLGRAPYVVYWGKYIGFVSLAT